MARLGWMHKAPGPTRTEGTRAAVTSATGVGGSVAVPGAREREEDESKDQEGEALHAGHSSSGGMAWYSPSM